MGYSPWGREESDTAERLHSLTSHLLLQLVMLGVSCDARSQAEHDVEARGQENCKDLNC